MPNLTKSADILIAEISANVKSELYRTIEPITKSLMQAVSDLEKALSPGRVTAPAVTPRRGRPARRKPGRPARAAAAKATKPAAPARAAGKPKRKRGPRGALRNQMQAIMQKAGKPMKFSEIRDEIMRIPEFKKRDPKSLYTQIVLAMKKIPQAEKTAQGAYRIR